MKLLSTISFLLVSAIAECLDVLAARLLGGAGAIAATSVSAKGDTWTFGDPEGKLLVRFPICGMLSSYLQGKDAVSAQLGQDGNIAFEEEHLHKLYLYVELNSSYEITDREVQPGCAALDEADYIRTCPVLNGILTHSHVAVHVPVVKRMRCVSLAGAGQGADMPSRLQASAERRAAAVATGA